MLTYDDLVIGLEDAWRSAGLHEHTLVESVLPESHERSYRAELFPDHAEPLTEETMPPWVDLTFTWSASHQLRSEGHDIAVEPLDLSWTYTVFVRGIMVERSDQELVRMFQRALETALQRFYPEEATETGQIAVEVRRIYQGDGIQLRLAYVQLVSTNITDLSDQWVDPDPRSLHTLLRVEVQLASAVIQALSDAFHHGGHGGYRAASTA